MSLHEKERRIRDERLLEATRADIVGGTGKLSVVVRFLGQPLVAHHRAEDAAWFDDEGMGETHVADWDEDDEVFELGWHFDGGPSGMPLVIKYLADEAELTAHYDGQPVYREVAGELEAFVPGPWLSCLNKFHRIAKAKEQTARQQAERERRQEAAAAKESFLKRLWDTWGYRV